MKIISHAKKFVSKLFNPNKLLKQQNAFLLTQVMELSEKVRYLELGQRGKKEEQTRASFDYQWKEIPEGQDLPSNPAFINNVDKQICELTQLPKEWFEGKNVIDVGCGIGRYSYGLLSLGAHVTSCDQSLSALQRVKDLCAPFKNRSETMTINLLNDTLPKEQYDLAWCFGVVHHTGNTYLAIKNVCNAVKNGGKVFFMIYGFPENTDDFIELNAYDYLRTQLHALPFETKKKKLENQFSKELVHGWFDAVSPEINDLLSYQEAVSFLNSCGIKNIKRTIINRNLHLIGDKY